MGVILFADKTSEGSSKGCQSSRAESTAKVQSYTRPFPLHVCPLTGPTVVVLQVVAFAVHAGCGLDSMVRRLTT